MGFFNFAREVALKNGKFLAGLARKAGKAYLPALTRRVEKVVNRSLPLFKIIGQGLQKATDFADALASADLEKAYGVGKEAADLIRSQTNVKKTMKKANAPKKRAGLSAENFKQPETGGKAGIPDERGPKISGDLLARMVKLTKPI